MKLKYEFVINDVAGTSIAVPVGENSSELKGYIRLNDTGASIFKLLKDDISEEKIVESLLKEYEGATKEEITKTVSEFLGKLKESGVLIDA